MATKKTTKPAEAKAPKPSAVNVPASSKAVDDGTAAPEATLNAHGAVGGTGVTNMLLQKQDVTPKFETADGESPLKHSDEVFEEVHSGKSIEFWKGGITPPGVRSFRVKQPKGGISGCMAFVLTKDADDPTHAYGAYVRDLENGIAFTIPCDVAADRVELTMPDLVTGVGPGEYKIAFMDNNEQVFARTKVFTVE